MADWFDVLPVQYKGNTYKWLRLTSIDGDYNVETSLSQLLLEWYEGSQNLKESTFKDDNKIKFGTMLRSIDDVRIPVPHGKPSSKHEKNTQFIYSPYAVSVQ